MKRGFTEPEQCNLHNIINSLDHQHETWYTCSSCSQLQNATEDFYIFVQGLSYDLSKSKK